MVTGEAAEALVEAVVVEEVAVVAEVLEEVAVEAAVAQGAAVEVDAELPEVVEDQGEGAGADVGEDPKPLLLSPTDTTECSLLAAKRTP